MTRWPVRLLALLSASPLALAQGVPSSPAVRVQPAQTELVRIDVIVSDKSGRPRLGLTAEDFEVLEDGVPRPVSQFRAFAAPPAANAAAPEPPADAPAPAGVPEAPPRRLVLLAVDDIHLDPANLLRLRKTLDRFLERDVPAGDLVGLVTTSGTQSHPLTTDRDAVRAAVSRVSAHSRRAAPLAGAAHITDYQAEMIELGDPEALRAAVEEIEAAQPTPNAEAQARAVARQVLAESVTDARATLATLDGVVRGMEGLPGRKILVLCSDGFLTGLGTAASAAFDIRRITDAGTRAGVIVYGLDSRGLRSDSTGPSASSRRLVLPTIMGARERVAQAGELAVHDAMNALAADTGGLLQAFTNDLAGALRTIVHDTDAYYLLAYEPTSARRDGAFRKIEVRVPRLKGARVRHRKGYFALDARAAAAVPPAAPVSGAPTDALRDALSSEAPADGLRVGLSAGFVSADASSSQIVVSGHVELRGVPFTRIGNRHLATVDVAASVFDESGNRVADLPVERAPLDLDDDSHTLALRNGLQFEKPVAVPPGRYRVVLAARESDGGSIGKATEWVEVPDLAGGRVVLSSLFLTRHEGAASPRKAQVDRLFRSKDSMGVEFFVYAARTGLVSKTEVWQGGVLLSASRPEPIAASDAAGRPRAHTRKFPVGAFPPGTYEVRVVVSDEQGTEASARAAFRVQ